ncbi:hypothetical protein H6F50_23490 [Coleofasciculus sp. FACHB-712]|uniref:hypothetical protein n=1 Tax=Coleofasciculus sp. FACHB-712 TaxID=2692789 RepID=UPI00168937ED|nr:hypothetical protein [Coleofasciculus sp. FACHB-712]MBD1882386.1 hypothetical protein [Coleofasciculus sp. FACHB-T130]MBD1945278.1 hypothetical protein [Coleofasciculus sp. FACHB-712]
MVNKTHRIAIVSWAEAWQGVRVKYPVKGGSSDRSPGACLESINLSLLHEVMIFNAFL